MYRITILLACLVFSHNLFAITQCSNLGPFTLYSTEQQYFFVDYANAECYNYDTGVLTKDPVAYVRQFGGSPANGSLYIYQSGNYFGYRSNSGTTNKKDTFSIRPYMKDGVTNFIIDYEMNIIPSSQIIKLLDVPGFDASAINGLANLLVSAYDKETGARVTREDIDVSIFYYPWHGTISPHVSGFPDVFTYVADSGFSGWDVVGVVAKNRAGKMGYNYIYIYVAP